MLELGWYGAVVIAIRQFGWIYGLLAFYLVWKVYTWAALKFFGLEHLSGMDAFWFHDDQRNYANIITFIRTHKWNDVEETKKQLFDRAMTFPRMRSCIKKFAGTWWFKDIPMAEMQRNRDKLVRVCNDVHNEKQLTDFMAREQSIRDGLDNVQWRCWLFPEYSPTESLFVFKVHHCVADGVGLILMTGNLVDNPDVKTFPQITIRFPWWQRILINLLVPFMIAMITAK